MFLVFEFRNSETDFSDEQNFSCTEYTSAFPGTRVHRGRRMRALFSSGALACCKRFIFLRCMNFVIEKLHLRVGYEEFVPERRDVH